VGKQKTEKKGGVLIGGGSYSHARLGPTLRWGGSITFETWKNVGRPHTKRKFSGTCFRHNKVFAQQGKMRALAEGLKNHTVMKPLEGEERGGKKSAAK